MANESMIVSSGFAQAANPPRDLRAPVAALLRRGAAFDGLRSLAWMLVDGLVLAAAWWLADGALAAPWLVAVALPLGLLAGAGIYGGKRPGNPLAFVWPVGLGYSLLAVLAALQPALLGGAGFDVLVRSALLAVLLLPAVRFVGRAAIDGFYRLGFARVPVFIVGEAADRERLLAVLARQARYRVIGEADVAAAEPAGLIARLEETGVEEVFVCSWRAVTNLTLLYWQLKSSGIRLRVLPVVEELPRRDCAVAMLGGLPTLRFEPPALVGIDFRLKRLFDLVATSAIVLVIAPLLVAIALLIRLDSPGPVFFRQTRVGLGGRHFKVWKFRTMVNDAEQQQAQLEARNEMRDGVMFKLKDDPRVTRVGRLLRRWSLDELPQLFNVLAGEMSLVGPRPFPLRDVERFRGEHFFRQRVLPGITGLWQVSGRSEITDFEQVIRLDTDYIRHWSLGLDLQILLRTVAVVLRREGAY